MCLSPPVPLTAEMSPKCQATDHGSPYFFRTGSSGVMEHFGVDLERDIGVDLNNQELLKKENNDSSQKLDETWIVKVLTVRKQSWICIFLGKKMN